MLEDHFVFKRAIQVLYLCGWALGSNSYAIRIYALKNNSDIVY